MGRYKNKGRLTALFIVGLLLITNLGTLGAAEPSDPSAYFYLSPSTSSATSGASLSIELRVKVVNDSTHSARARLTYPSDKMEVTGVSPSPAFSIPAENSYGNGVINAAYGSFASISGDQLFATINFKMNAASGEASVIIDPIIDASSHSYVTGDASGTGANILKSVSNGIYSITKTGSSSRTGPVSSPIGQNQTKQPANAAPDNTNQTSAGANTGTAGTNSINTVESGAELTNGDSVPVSAGVIDKTIVLLALPTLVLAAFGARHINRRYKRRKSRSIHSEARRETVADIAARLKNADRSKETVAEMTARINRQDRSGETVAELAARLNRKAKRKSRTRLSRAHRKHR